MNRVSWLPSALLAAAALAACWPGTVLIRRVRQRTVLAPPPEPERGDASGHPGSSDHPGRSDRPDRSGSSGSSGSSSRTLPNVRATVPLTGTVEAPGRRSPDDAARPLVDRVRRWPTRRLVLVGAAGSGLLGLFASGPVAGLVVAVYAGLAVHAGLRRPAARAAVRLRREQLDALASLAADLRAGLPMVTTWSAAEPDRLSRLVAATVGLAEQTGAPLADLVDRIVADARATDRGQAAAAAQSAGAQATAWLLAALPAGGIALGYAIGVDPIRILLHTPTGAGCAVGAVGLQLAGLAWARRLSTPATGVG